MEAFVDLFSSREQAAIIWLVLILILMLFRKNLREDLYSLLKAFLRAKILILLLLMSSYVSVVAYLLSGVGLWNVNLLKETVFWLVGTALLSLFHVVGASKKDRYFLQMTADNLKFVLVLVFLIDFYSFSLPVELAVIPILVLLIAGSVYAEKERDFQSGKNLFDLMLSLWIVFVVGYVLVRAFGDYKNLLTGDNLLALLLPFFLTLLWLPFLYLFAVFVAYENVFVRIDIMVGSRSKQLARVTKWELFRKFLFNVRELNDFSRQSGSRLAKIQSEEELVEILIGSSATVHEQV